MWCGGLDASFAFPMVRLPLPPFCKRKLSDQAMEQDQRRMTEDEATVDQMYEVKPCVTNYRSNSVSQII